MLIDGLDWPYRNTLDSQVPLSSVNVFTPLMVDALNTGGDIETRKLWSVEVEAAPSTAKDCAAGAEDIVGNAEPRRPEQSA